MWSLSVRRTLAESTAGRPPVARRRGAFEFAMHWRNFMTSIGHDADGELYAVTRNFTPTGLQGRFWKIIDASE